MSRAIETEQVGIGPLADEPKGPTEQAEGAVVGLSDTVAALASIAGLAESAMKAGVAALQSQAPTPASVSPGTSAASAPNLHAGVVGDLVEAFKPLLNAVEMADDLNAARPGARRRRVQDFILDSELRALAKYATQGTGGDRHLQIGQPCEVSPNYRFSEWNGVPLFVCGIRADTLSGAIFYSVSEHWPPSGNGDITTDFPAADLQPRATHQPAISTDRSGEDA